MKGLDNNFQAQRLPVTYPYAVSALLLCGTCPHAPKQLQNKVICKIADKLAWRGSIGPLSRATILIRLLLPKPQRRGAHPTGLPGLSWLPATNKEKGESEARSMTRAGASFPGSRLPNTYMHTVAHPTTGTWMESGKIVTYWALYWKKWSFRAQETVRCLNKLMSLYVPDPSLISSTSYGNLATSRDVTTGHRASSMPWV